MGRRTVILVRHGEYDMNERGSFGLTARGREQARLTGRALANEPIGKVLSSSLMQIHKELEEASRICGRGTLQTILRIVLPIARPGVVAAMTLLFILSIRELGSSLFLFTNDTIVMAVLLLDLYEGGNAGAKMKLRVFVLCSVL